MAEQVGNKQVIQGEDIIVTVDGKPTLHATSHTLKVDLEVKDVRTKDTNGKEKYPGDISWSVDVEGLVVIDADLASSHDKPEDILQTILSKTNVGVVLKANIQGLLTKNYSGNGYITSFSLGTPAGDNATYNFSITGSGNLNPVNPS
jgi:predicted secreted protein